jgi:hypothetical protein
MEIVSLELVGLRNENVAGKPVGLKLEHHPRRRSGIGLLVRVIAGADQRARLDVAETEAERFIPQIVKFCRFVETSDGEMIFRRAQILPDGENVDSTGAKVAEDFDQFVGGFAEAYHDAALGHHAG